MNPIALGKKKKVLLSQRDEGEEPTTLERLLRLGCI